MPTRTLHAEMVSRSVPCVAVWTGWRVSGRHGGRRASEVVDTEVQRVGQEPSEARVFELADCAFCVDCEQLATFWLTRLGPHGKMALNLARWPLWMIERSLNLAPGHYP